MPYSAKAICKSVEVEFQTVEPDAPRIMFFFDRVSRNADVVTTAGTCLK